MSSDPVFKRVLRPLVHRAFRVINPVRAALRPGAPPSSRLNPIPVLRRAASVRIQRLRHYLNHDAKIRIGGEALPFSAVMVAFSRLWPLRSPELGLSPAAVWLPFRGAGIGKNPVGRQIVMLTPSNLRIDPRIEREARALVGAGYDVVVIAPDPRVGEETEHGVDWGPGISFRWTHWTAISFVMEWPSFIGRAMFNTAIEYRPFAFHAHDLFTALIGLSAARLTGAHVVCDFHEWFSENVKWDAESLSYKPYTPSWKRPLQWLERQCLKKASEVVTVCDSIADTMAAELGRGRKAVVVRNIPRLSQEPTKPYPPIKQQLGLPDDSFVLLWQGGTGPTRLIEPIIEALAFMPKCHFVIRGPSLDLFGPGYRAIAERIGAGDRLILIDPVPSRDVVAAARGADAGIWTLPNFCRNFSFALPNKVFEYMASGLPVIGADYPEVRRIVDGHKVGALFDPYDPKSIAAAITPLIDDRALAAAIRERIPVALATLDADREWEKIPAIYDRLRRRAA